MDTERILSDAATIFLIWRQNKILALQGPPMPPANWSERLRRAERYWPLIAMAMLAIAIWLQPIVYGRYWPPAQAPVNGPPTDAQKLSLLAGPIGVGANIERLIQAPNAPYKVKITAPNADPDSLGLRNLVTYFFNFPNSKCAVVDNDKNQSPDTYTLARLRLRRTREWFTFMRLKIPLPPI